MKSIANYINESLFDVDVNIDKMQVEMDLLACYNDLKNSSLTDNSNNFKQVFYKLLNKFEKDYKKGAIKKNDIRKNPKGTYVVFDELESWYKTGGIEKFTYLDGYKLYVWFISYNEVESKYYAVYTYCSFDEKFKIRSKEIFSQNGVSTNIHDVIPNKTKEYSIDERHIFKVSNEFMNPTEVVGYFKK